MTWSYFLELVDTNYLIARRVDNKIEANIEYYIYIPFYKNFYYMPVLFSIFTEKQQFIL